MDGSCSLRLVVIASFSEGSAKALLPTCVPFWAWCFASAERALGFCRWNVLRPALGKPGAACAALLSSRGAI